MISLGPVDVYTYRPTRYVMAAAPVALRLSGTLN